ncbi:MAG: MMPL family transporter, partial [Chloroflexi bacterium]|nr:MMPL family transporter [Chloroflexota bacterium]
MTSILNKAEATETRTLINLRDLDAAFSNASVRPAAAAGPILGTYEKVVRDWVTASGAPGDKFDPDLAALYDQATAGVEVDRALMQEVLDRIGRNDATLDRLLVNDPNGIDSILVQFPAYNNEPSQTATLQEEIEALWFGDDENVTATSDSIVSITVTDSITRRQTEAISATVAVALTVLAVFFWITIRQPMLSIVAVGPIVLVLICVLGTMALIGIPYTLITSIITALSIGIGVDYTIHVIHRYREEFAKHRNPETAAVRTLSITGSALLGSGLTTALGLGMLVLAPLAASQQFGFTAAITIFYSLLFSILVVPPAMTVCGAYQNMRLRSMVERMW